MTSSDLIPLSVTQVDLTHPGVGPLVADVVGRDESRDIAVLRIHVPDDIPHLAFKDPPIVPIGEFGVVVGYRGTAAGGVGATAVPGDVSSTRPYDGAQYFQVNVAYSAGLSGAPVIDQNFRVLGMVSLRREIVAPGSQPGTGLFVSVVSLIANLDNLKRGSQIFYPHSPPVPGAIPPPPPFPLIFQGEAYVDGVPIAVGATIQARLAGYITPIIKVEVEGRYPFIRVNPPIESGYAGETITFYVDGFLASETHVYEIDEKDPIVDLILTAYTQ